MYDKGYFESYAKAPGDWLRGYRLRLYFYEGVTRILHRAAPSATSMAEFGCGLGMFSFHIKNRRSELRIDAFDISPYASHIARERLSDCPRVTVREGDAQNTGLPTGAYDIVVSLDVIEHLPDPQKMIAEAWRILKPGGTFFFSTPNPESLGARLKRPRAQASGLVSDAWFADKDETHINIRSVSAWRDMCHCQGFLRLRDGTDSLWDTPYFSWLPTFPQKLIGNGSQRILVPWIGILPWKLGENYLALWRKP